MPVVKEPPRNADIVVQALGYAAADVGVLEEPPGSNRGVRVDGYVKSVGLNPSGAYPWCAALVYDCFRRAALKLEAKNPCPRTGSALGLWLKSKPEQQIAPAGVVAPGMIFVLDLGHGTGHVGFIEKVEEAGIFTIEGNSNEGGAREGIGVFRRQRVFNKSLKGFLDFSGAARTIDPLPPLIT